MAANRPEIWRAYNSRNNAFSSRPELDTRNIYPYLKMNDRLDLSVQKRPNTG